MKAFVMLADGFEDIETLAPIDILRRGGVEVITVSITDSEYVKSSHNVVIKADALIAKTDFTSGDALILPGGYPGYENLGKSAAVGDVLKKYFTDKKLIAAICGAPTVLAANNVAVGAAVTCHSCAVEIMKQKYDYRGGDVVRDGNIITAVGAGLSIDFGFEILDALVDDEIVDKVKKAMELQL